MLETAENRPLVCHCLIGPPGSGKSTLAQQWVARSPQYQWISTDHIREELFGDASVQGDWAEVEAVAIARIKAAITQHQPVIYDATNARRTWRLELMQKLGSSNTEWMAWWLKIPLAECKRNNQRRQRQLEDAVIEKMYRSIKAMPPIPAEGFAAVNPVPLLVGAASDQENASFDLSAIERKIQSLPQSLLQRQRRQGQYQLHQYSSLLAFEQLLYLIATLLQYPGAGTLQQSDPALVQKALCTKRCPRFESPVAEIGALIARQYGSIYADLGAIAQNSKWLQDNHIINASYTVDPIELSAIEGSPTFALHRYSDRDAFMRLIGTFRFVAHHPFLYVPGQGSLKTLVGAMESRGVIPPGYTDSVRRDFGEILKPYGLMPQPSQIQGYFVGTAVLSKSELLRVFSSLAGQAQHLNDPVLLTTYERFRDRLTFLHPDLPSPAPVRTVLQQPIVNLQTLPSDTASLAASGNAERLEDAILQHQVLTLKRRRGTGRFGGEIEAAFQALPLQIVFHNIAWYLGYQQISDGLLRFERLDRLEMLQVGAFTRTKAQQATAQQALMRLYEASYGIYLGSSATEQQQLLSNRPEQRAAVEAVCELWFSDSMFRFVSEGTQRFVGRQQMSPRLLGSAMTALEKKTIFCLSKTGHSQFPNRFKVRLPQWVLTHDVDFKRWVLGFGGHVKVIAPQALADNVQSIGQEIWKAYTDVNG